MLLSLYIRQYSSKSFADNNIVASTMPRNGRITEEKRQQVKLWEVSLLR